ncbi:MULTISPECIES: cold shock domain-containing protein [Pseudoalteromonas]|uniref:cold shock domain-containing protein n=1 Tax=Pseudoalteromonas TaxID=53246 RepID=UPI0015F90B9C|nr:MULTISPECIES: cold shock domain-containing protein [Pseudoalteromonas]MBB1378489.1 excalibur calcium-binding domain-containing protein [Pseudoalteromonas sp. SR43-2]MBD0409246.1 excalibur calcium-binding domain-containing protein [Pseudoalteromonas distincta]
MNKGLLKSWKTDKGFGFIKSDTLEHDTFIHISALKHMSRKPKVGDTIYFEVATQPDGKTKAVNCRIEGVAELKAPYQKHNNQPHRIAKSNFASSFLGKVALIALIAALCFYAINKYNTHSSSQTPIITNDLATNDDLATFDETYPKVVIPKSTQNFTCDGRQYCTEMRSRDEAVFFINNCPNTKMDGDGDGNPCERDTRF